MSDSERVLLALLCLTFAGGADAAAERFRQFPRSVVQDDASGAAERFRLSPGSVVQNDATGQEGTLGHARGLSYEVVQGYAVAEGDMVLGRVDGSGRLEVPIQRRGLGQASLFDRWPDGIVPYRFSPKLTAIQKRHVQSAIDKLNARTRVELVAADDPAASGYSDHLMFEPSGGCASFVGRQLNEDAQSLWVADSCSVGSIMHEIAHAIGLFHEHTRPDRDNYVNVVWDRIIEGKEFNFEIYEDSVQTHGEYDYGSIMHYGADFFSRDGKPTIVPPTNVQIGQRLALSADDVRSIDRMYATDLALDVSTHESELGMEIDVSVTNAGELGARLLVLRMRGRADTDWRSISVDSGWDCLAGDEELRCERERLIEQAVSRFTILADAADVDADTLAVRLESRTLDLDPSNNVLNDAVFGAGETDEAEGQRALSGSNLAGKEDDTGNENGWFAAPALGGAVDNDDGQAGSPGGGGGGGGPLTLLVTALALAARRRARSVRRG